MSDELNLNKLAWRARRGTKELDSILQGFLNEHFADLDTQQQRQFAFLLEQADPDISDWLNAYSVPKDKGLAQIVSRILATLRS